MESQNNSLERIIQYQRLLSKNESAMNASNNLLHNLKSTIANLEPQTSEELIEYANFNDTRKINRKLPSLQPYNMWASKLKPTGSNGNLNKRQSAMSISESTLSGQTYIDESLSRHSPSTESELLRPIYEHDDPKTDLNFLYLNKIEFLEKELNNLKEEHQLLKNKVDEMALKNNKRNSKGIRPRLIRLTKTDLDELDDQYKTDILPDLPDV